MNGTGGRERWMGHARRFNHQMVDRDRVLRKPHMRITPPAPGVAMLACHCGRVLSRGGMYRRPALRPPPEVTSGGAGPLARIVCADCATAPTPKGRS